MRKPQIAAVWFGDKERTLATGIGSLSSVLGMAFSFIVGPLFVHKGSDFSRLFLFHAILGFISSCCCFLWAKDKPTNPPSSSAEMPKEEFGRIFKTVVKNKNFLLLTAAFGIGSSSFISIFTGKDFAAAYSFVTHGFG
jgi:sugar phosphate permease